MKIFNTVSKSKEEFKPIGKTVSFYACGPTVYNYAHLGNLRTYVFNDIFKRSLVYLGYDVKQVMNITDVGHLTDDADSGEDKMEKGAAREGKTVWEIAEHYTDAFKNDMKKLNIQEPDVWCKATDHIQDMIDMIKKLEEKGFTYEAGGNVYYDTSKFSHYSELGRLKLDEIEEGARTKVDENKKNPSDFVLWFTLEGSKYGEGHTMKWESPWGVGYPGWHIECSAMSSKYLGEQFDIHTGGIDHISVHHSNEIAQAEGTFDKHPWVKYWVHSNFLVLNKDKMAKSGDNFLTLQLLEDKGFDTLAYRYFCLNAHYRSELNFSWEAVENAQNGFNKFKNKVMDLRNESDGSNDVSKYEKKFEEAVSDDMNMPVALATTLELVNDDKLSSKARLDTLQKFDSVLGFDVDEFEEEKVDVPSDVKKLVDKREQARADKDWALADKLRDEIKEKGYILEDSKDGIKVKKS